VSETQIRAEMVEVGRRLYTRGLIAANEGNISARDGDTLYVTPSGVCKGFLAPEAIVRADLAGNALDAGQQVSSEIQMHVAIYRRRQDVSAVVHAHPPTATAFAVAGIPLDRPLIAEAVLTLGPVVVIPYGTPSTSELADNVGQAICDSHGLLLANHGALTVGETLLRAWERMETVEQLARVALASRVLGQGNPLPKPAVSQLEAMRATAGYPPPSCVDCPSCGSTIPLESGDRVMLSRGELVRLIVDAVERFGGGA
jgi:L-fuculose-phosphate aldolase